MTPRGQMAARGCFLVAVAAVTFAGLRWCDGEPVPSPVEQQAATPNATDRSVGAAARWWSGGTLHDATLEEWSQADASNRLATAGDMTFHLKNVSDAEFAAMVAEGNDLAALRPAAAELVACLDEVATGEAELVPGVAQTAAACAVLMGWMSTR